MCITRAGLTRRRVKGLSRAREGACRAKKFWVTEVWHAYRGRAQGSRKFKYIELSVRPQNFYLLWVLYPKNLVFVLLKRNVNSCKMVLLYVNGLN